MTETLKIYMDKIQPVTNVPLQLPKLKKINKNKSPKLQLPKLKKING
jgi:hypothetical protein